MLLVEEWRSGCEEQSSDGALVETAGVVVVAAGGIADRATRPRRLGTADVAPRTGTTAGAVENALDAVGVAGRTASAGHGRRAGHASIVRMAASLTLVDTTLRW